MALSGRISWSLFGLVALVAVVGNAEAGDQGEATPPLPSNVRFDPAAMPEVKGTTAPLGFRYATLSDHQTKALRRGFKLPLDALTNAQSTADLLSAVKVAPLPDPNQPLLSVATDDTQGSTNPFVSARATSFRDDPMKALGELLAAVDGVDPNEEALPADNDPFASDAALSPATTSASSDSAEANATTGSDDPFGDDSDPFGSDEDPFGDF